MANKPPLDTDFDNPRQVSGLADGSFIFSGDKYSLSILRNATLIKTYQELRYEESGLFRDRYGRLFIKTWREEMCFDGGNDRIDITYCFVKNEEEADLLYMTNRCIWGVEPYIYESGDGFVSVHE